MKLVMGIDHGNGAVKARSNVRNIVLPSFYAELEAFGEGTGADKSLDLVSYSSAKYEGETYLWGRDVRKANYFNATYTVENRYNTKEYKLLSEFTMASLLPNDQNTFEGITVVTGCPSGEKGTAMEEELKKVYLGGHIVTVNGVSKTFHVDNVIVLPQPLGTVLSLYLDEKGFVEDESYENVYCGVIDVGSGTTDIDGIRSLKRIKEDMKTIPMGIHDVYSGILDYVHSKNTSANVSIQSVEKQIASDFYKVSEREKYPIDEVKKKEYEKLASRLIVEIRQKWKTQSNFDRIILTGGGATPLGIHFKNWIKDIIVLEDSQKANANGFYRYGLFKTMEE